MKFLVFYAGLLYKECSTHTELRQTQVMCPTEVYNGAYFYAKPERKWYRMDGTPVLDCDVPKELKVILLLI